MGHEAVADDDTSVVEFDPFSTPEPADWAAATQELIRRCEKAGLQLRERKFEENEIIFTLELPCGRGVRSITLIEHDDIASLLRVQFERYVFLSNFEAICSYEDSLIEASIRSLGPFPTTLAYRRIFGLAGSSKPDQRDLAVAIRSDTDDDAPTMFITPATETLQALSGGARRILSLQIRNVRVSQHDQAVRILEKLCNALFFQIDLLFGLTFTLDRERRNPNNARARRAIRNVGESIQYPSYEYDDGPLSLYWYAKSAVGMPLLQFLAFYQVLEFYFSIYFEAEARRKVRAILKNPAFRVDRDTDVGKILSSIRAGSRTGFGDERSQLRATIMECVDSSELRNFIEADDERMEFLSSKVIGLTQHKIPVNNKGADLRNDVADRIYDIRCKIVHTKSERGAGEFELLLPFSKESEQLHYDIELIQFLAQKVLISASSPLNTRAIVGN